MNKERFFSNPLGTALHVCVLFGFAVAQPLYELLIRFPEYLIVQRCEYSDLVVLSVLLSLMLPLLCFCFAWLTRKANARWQTGALALVIAGLTGLILMPVFTRIGFPPALSIPLTLIGAVLFGGLYFRSSALKLFLSLLIPSILIFPARFLWSSRPFYPETSAFSLPASQVKTVPPVVILVFDELPLASLLDERAHIDRIRYPHFAALTETATWFPNARSASSATAHSLVAMLTGTEMADEKPALFTNYPENLFTILSGSYSLKVLEAATRLCPDELNTLRVRQSESRIQRFKLVLKDLAVVYAHTVSPVQFSWLPPINRTWGDFLGGRSGGKDFHNLAALEKASLKAKAATAYRNRPTLLLEAFSEIRRRSKPHLYFFHSFLPHLPWEYLPNGQRYMERSWQVPGLNISTETWEPNLAAVELAYQRHLLQVGLVDRLLGRLIARLTEAEIYDDTLLIVVSDHGASFWPGRSRRAYQEDLGNDVLAVPLLVKKPGQRQGHIDDRHLTTQFLLTMVGEVLGFKVADHPLQTAGQNWSELWQTDATLRRKLALFGSQTAFPALRAFPGAETLFGATLEEANVTGTFQGPVSIIDAVRYQNVDAEAPFLPVLISGSVTGVDTLKAVPMGVVVALNGVIQGTGALQDANGQWRFSVLVPPSALVNGSNRVDILIAVLQEGELALLRSAYSE